MSQDKITALRSARRILLEQRSTYLSYVCNCLKAVPHSQADAAHRLQVYISERLGRHTTLDNWLRQNRPELPIHSAAMLSYRLQWIDWMIEQLEAP